MGDGLPPFRCVPFDVTLWLRCDPLAPTLKRDKTTWPFCHVVLLPRHTHGIRVYSVSGLVSCLFDCLRASLATGLTF